jgi:hypothetical protein
MTGMATGKSDAEGSKTRDPTDRQDRRIEEAIEQLDTEHTDDEPHEASPPSRRLHSLRSGDGRSVPEVEPPELWPDMSVLEPYWDSFVAFAMDELDGRIEFSFRLEGNGKWTFVARQAPDRAVEHRDSLRYDPAADTLTFNDPAVGSGWEMTDVFGVDTLAQEARDA